MIDIRDIFSTIRPHSECGRAAGRKRDVSELASIGARFSALSTPNRQPPPRGYGASSSATFPCAHRPDRRADGVSPSRNPPARLGQVVTARATFRRWSFGAETGRSRCRGVFRWRLDGGGHAGGERDPAAAREDAALGEAGAQRIDRAERRGVHREGLPGGRITTLRPGGGAGRRRGRLATATPRADRPPPRGPRPERRCGPPYAPSTDDAR